MRRIRPTAQTVERLLDVFDRVAVRDRNGVIEALGNCEASAWSPRVERLLVACTGDPEHNNVVHAVEALCFKARLPETVDALVSLLKGGSPILDTVLRTLGILLSGSLGPRVAQRLEEIRTSAPEDVRLAISTRLGEWPADLAPPLLAPYAADPSPAVRAAAEASLARYAPPVGEG
jgi:HEAT repeat protein